MMPVVTFEATFVDGSASSLYWSNQCDECSKCTRANSTWRFKICGLDKGSRQDFVNYFRLQKVLQWYEIESELPSGLLGLLPPKGAYLHTCFNHGEDLRRGVSVSCTQSPQVVVFDQFQLPNELITIMLDNLQLIGCEIVSATCDPVTSHKNTAQYFWTLKVDRKN